MTATTTDTTIEERDSDLLDLIGGAGDSTGSVDATTSTGVPAATPAATTGEDDERAHAATTVSAADALARRERRQMNVAWGCLVLGMVVSLGTFFSIAAHDATPSDGIRSGVTSTAP